MGLGFKSFFGSNELMSKTGKNMFKGRCSARKLATCPKEKSGQMSLSAGRKKQPFNQSLLGG